jgi:hypothetical protein
METFNFNVKCVELTLIHQKFRIFIATASSEEVKVQTFSPRIGVEKKGEILSIWEKHSMKALLKEPIMGFSPPRDFEKTFLAKKEECTDDALSLYLPLGVTIRGMLKKGSVIETAIEEDFKRYFTLVK